MIGRLQGTLIAKHPPMLLLDVAGVGYEVEASMQTFYQLPELGKPLTLLTHFVVRDDAQLLYGFYEERERTLFRTLIKVNGVGPKLALAILSSVNPDEFVHCVQINDTSSLTRIPGVGKKTAERLIIEMRDRLQNWESIQHTANHEGESLSISMGNERLMEQEAISALTALGYKPQEAAKAIRKVERQGMTTEQIIRHALQNMMG